MDDALNPTHALALANYDVADGLLTRLCQLADPRVEHLWADRDAQRAGAADKVKWGRGWWAKYPLRSRMGDEPSPTWGGSYLSWGLQDDWGRQHEARKTYAFVAGASASFNDDPMVVADNAGWVNDFRANGFAVYKGDRHRVWAYLYPEQLLAETTIEGQARYLADWVYKTFTTVTSVAPPHPPAQL